MRNYRINNGANHQDLLKTIAIVFMIIDHIGLYFFPDHQIMRLIGRTAMPVFMFFAGYNFHGTPGIRILSYGIVLYAITTLLFSTLTTTNILITVYLGQCYIYIYEILFSLYGYKVFDIRNFYIAYLHAVVLVLLVYCTGHLIDYGTLAIGVMVLGYGAKHSKGIVFQLFTAIAFAFSALHTYLNFSSFPPSYIIAAFFLAALGYVLTVIRKPEAHININLKLISRNALIIYVVHLAIIQFVFLVITLSRI